MHIFGNGSNMPTATAERAAYVHLHARVLAHELSNLTFLAEIQARAPSVTAGNELRRGLPNVRRLARLVADALAPQPKRRVITLAAALEEIETLLVAPSKGLLPTLEIGLPPELAEASTCERCPALLLIVQELFRQTGDAGERLILTFKGEGENILIHATSTRPLAVSPFLAIEAARNDFRTEEQASPNGRVTIILPWVRDDL